MGGHRLPAASPLLPKTGQRGGKPAKITTSPPARPCVRGGGPARGLRDGDTGRPLERGAGGAGRRLMYCTFTQTANPPQRPLSPMVTLAGRPVWPSLLLRWRPWPPPDGHIRECPPRWAPTRATDAASDACPRRLAVGAKPETVHGGPPSTTPRQQWISWAGRGPMDGTLAGLCRFWLRSFLLLTARRRRGATTSHLASMHGRPCHVLCKFVYVHTNPSRRRMLCIGSGPRGAGLGEGLGRGPRAATTAKASQRHRPKRLGARKRRWRVPPVARDWPLARDF